MSRACESCGHSESHEPRTANLSSGRCPKCGCLSGWQRPEWMVVSRDEATQITIFGTPPGVGPSWVKGGK